MAGVGTVLGGFRVFHAAIPVCRWTVGPGQDRIASRPIARGRGRSFGTYSPAPGTGVRRDGFMRYAMIMAGGAGTRLWPMSRLNRPK
jgi:Nucleotidyl transferase